MTIPSLWFEIERHLKQYAPQVLPTLRTPASDSAVNGLEAVLGRRVPAVFREYLQIHDGQDDPSRLNLLCEEGVLLSTASILQTWNMLNEINEGNPPGPVEWWDRKYLPFSDFEGDHASIDLESGEVVLHVHDQGIERGLAPDFQSWLEHKARVFAEGRFAVEGGLINFWKYGQ